MILCYSPHLSPYDAYHVDGTLYCGSAAYAQAVTIRDREARAKVADPLEMELAQMAMDRWLKKEDTDGKIQS